MVNNNVTSNGQTPIDQLTVDSYISAVMGFGVLGVDRTLDLIPARTSINQSKNIQEYEILHETNNYATNIIEQLPESLGENLPEFEYPDPDIADKIKSVIQEINPLFIDAAIKARIKGGSAILINTKFGDYADPLEKVKAEPVSYSVIEAGINGKLVVRQINQDPFSPNYNKPEFYGIRNSKILIHHSRVLPFYGIKPATDSQWREYKYWGIPVLQKSLKQIKALYILDRSIEQTLDKFSRLIVEVENLMSLLQNETGKASLNRRANQVNFTWNALRMMMTGKDEKVYYLTAEYSQLVQIIPHVMESLAASCDIPYSRIFNVGKSRGLSGSGSNSQSIDRAEERQWASYVASKWRKDWEPNLRKLIDYWLLVLGVQPESYVLKLPSLLQLSETEVLEIEKSKAEIAKIYSEIGAVTSDEIREALTKNIGLGSAISTS